MLSFCLFCLFYIRCYFALSSWFVRWWCVGSSVALLIIIVFVLRCFSLDFLEQRQDQRQRTQAKQNQQYKQRTRTKDNARTTRTENSAPTTRTKNNTKTKKRKHYQEAKQLIKDKANNQNTFNVVVLFILFVLYSLLLRS